MPVNDPRPVAFSLGDLPPGGPHLFGAVLGAQHREGILERLGSTAGQVVLFDFKGIHSTTASYLKETLICLLRVARTAFDGVPRNDLALDIYPMVTHVSDDVHEELDAVLRLHEFVCLNALDWNASGIARGGVIGKLDSHLRDTLKLLSQHGAATASMLAEAAPETHINNSGWNNRLNDLARHRLAWRHKEGRFWVYEPIAREVV